MKVPLISSPAFLKGWLTILCLLAAVAVGRGLFFPPWPKVRDISFGSFQRQFKRVGLDPRQQSVISQKPGFSRSFSQTLIWRLASGDELLLVNGRMRDPEMFQVAALTRGLPSLEMVSRRINYPETGVATGFVHNRQAIQTCFVALPARTPSTALTRAQLKFAISPVDTTWMERLRIIFGLPSHARNYSCLLVTLRSRSAAPLTIELWRRVQEALVASLAEDPLLGS